MRNQQGKALSSLRPPMDEVNADAVDFGRELFELVQPALVLTTVVALAPVRNQLPQVGLLGPITPVHSWDLVGPAGSVYALVQVAEHRIWHVDSEWCDSAAIGAAT